MSRYVTSMLCVLSFVYVCECVFVCNVWIKQNSQTYLILYTFSNLGSPGKGRISSEGHTRTLAAHV